jgi:hypothetical protein
MAEFSHQAGRQNRSPTSTARASGRTTSVQPEEPPPAAGLRGLRAALHNSSKVKEAAQLRRSLNQAPHAVQLARVTQMVQSGSVVQRLELTDAQWTHIAQGELRDGKKLVGYHWTGDDNAIARKNGTKKEGPDGRGVYVEGAETIEQYGQGKKRGPIVKTNASTFWPDTWTEAEIKNAIENGAKARNTRSEVSNKATKVAARGMTLIVNPDSIFPELGETVAEEEKGGRRTGKRR